MAGKKSQSTCHADALCRVEECARYRAPSRTDTLARSVSVLCVHQAPYAADIFRTTRPRCIACCTRNSRERQSGISSRLSPSRDRGRAPQDRAEALHVYEIGSQIVHIGLEAHVETFGHSSIRQFLGVVAICFHVPTATGRPVSSTGTSVRVTRQCITHCRLSASRRARARRPDRVHHRDQRVDGCAAAREAVGQPPGAVECPRPECAIGCRCPGAGWYARGGGCPV